VAAGYLVFAIGEGVILSGTAAGAAGSVPAFAAGTALWATGLLLVSIPREFPIVLRGLVMSRPGFSVAGHRWKHEIV
jgi:hypothetical protein